MTEDEKFVREHWLYPIAIERYSPPGWLWAVTERTEEAETEADVWADAAEFTRQRLKEIRQVEQCLASLKEGMKEPQK